jgi:hypothetical protein
MSFEIPKTVKATLYVQLIKRTRRGAEPYLSATSFKWDTDEYRQVLADIKEVEIEIELPELEIDLVSMQVTELKKQKEDLLAQTQLAVNDIDQQIQSLMAIEYTATVKD